MAANEEKAQKMGNFKTVAALRVHCASQSQSSDRDRIQTASYSIKGLKPIETSKSIRVCPFFSLAVSDIVRTLLSNNLQDLFSPFWVPYVLPTSVIDDTVHTPFVETTATTTTVKKQEQEGNARAAAAAAAA